MSKNCKSITSTIVLSLAFLCYIGICIFSFYNYIHKSKLPSYECVILDITECFSRLNTMLYKAVVYIPHCGNITLSFDIITSKGLTCDIYIPSIDNTKFPCIIDDCQIVNLTTLDLLLPIFLIAFIVIVLLIILIAACRDVKDHKLQLHDEPLNTISVSTRL